ncbi:hypothetical protein DPEC_G00041650 [Dallia pectoralis]|uniref:Uncharacterized protein n=1 Tax=Dallia pectoralis TaxID=75939 RepID=A0ACC2HGF8_DALPE|nr:hypothetical protein DPEC_G00041650 [Dallia pectoralis]
MNGIMSTLAEEIKKIIIKALPNICAETQEQLFNIFQSCGLECTEDLKYVRQEDIGDVLPVIQVRKLLEAFRLETETITLNLQAFQSPSTFSSSSQRSSPLPHSASSSSFSSPLPPDLAEGESSHSRLHQTWPETFQIPWDRMPPGIQLAISLGKRPKPADRRQMIRVLVDEMRKYEPSPKRSQCLTVTHNIIRQYPNSFADKFADGSLISGGYTSLLIQVKTRIENLNRDSIFVCHRTSSQAGGKRGPTDTYGCVRFQPPIPPEETEETVENKRQRLEEIFRQEGWGGIERAEVKGLMDITFFLQRRHINATPAPSINDIRNKWPYLFHQKSIMAHFQFLTDINALLILERSMGECGQAITEYFRNKSKDTNVKAVLSRGEGVEVAHCIVQLLMAHFRENTEGLIFLADVSATAADIEMTLSLPASPRLILLVSGGKELATIGSWMISLEGHVICEGIQPTFLSGLATVFAMYYIFNLQYQDEASCTLEFIQRRFIGINPERGSKATRGKVVSRKSGRVVQRKAVTVNTHVSTLLKNLMDFEWDFI